MYLCAPPDDADQHPGRDDGPHQTLLGGHRGGERGVRGRPPGRHRGGAQVPVRRRHRPPAGAAPAHALPERRPEQGHQKTGAAARTC